MSKNTRFIVFAAGLLGLVGLFLPFIVVKSFQAEGTVSAWKILTDSRFAEGRALIWFVFLPVLVIFTLGAVGVMRKGFGRGLGIPSMILGLLTLGIYALVYSAAKSVGAKDAVGLGLHLVLLTAVGAFIGGLVATIRPHKRADARAALSPR